MKCQKVSKPRYRFFPQHRSFGSLSIRAHKTSAVGKSFTTSQSKCSIKILNKRRFMNLKVKNQKISYLPGCMPMMFIMDDIH